MNGSSHSPTAINGAPSTPNGFSNGPATSSSASLSTHQLPPACGARQLSKLKRFLTTLQQFGNDISPEIGEKVRTLVLALVVSCSLGSPGDVSFCKSIVVMGSQQPTRAPIAQYHGPLQAELLAKHSSYCLCFLVNSLAFFFFVSAFQKQSVPLH